MQDRMDKMNNTASVMKQVVVLVGAGSIGQAIVRRVAAGKHVVLADYSLEHAQQAATTLENAGFECSTIQCDLGSKDDILRLVDFATGKGEVTNVINAAGVSPSQAPVEEILRVDLYGTSVLLEEFGKVIAPGGSGVIISSQSGHRLPALPQEQNEALAMSPCDELLSRSSVPSPTRSRPTSTPSAAMCCASWARQPGGDAAAQPSTPSALALLSLRLLMTSFTDLARMATCA